MSIYGTKNFNATSESVVVIDTNIFIYLFSPTTKTDAKRAAKYSVVFSNIICNNVKILLTDVQISEIINVIIRMRFEEYKRTNSLSAFKFKDFRKTIEYKNELRNVQILISKILPFATLVNHGLCGQTVQDFLKQSLLDYNDYYLENLASKNEASIITHDADFENASVDVYTENEKILI